MCHLSDVHFGRIATPAVVEALVEEVNAQRPALVAVSGDLTQRARRSQFRRAAEMLARFEAPVMVVPGNHDVAAWYRPFSRLFRPISRYRQMITDELMPTFTAPGLAVLGINTAHGLTIKGGRLLPEHAVHIRSFFSEQPAAALRVLVLHHHLTFLDALGKHDVARRAALAIEAIEEQRVDVLLCGHLHKSHVERLRFTADGPAVVVASAGTATSDRGREAGPNRRVNFYNHIHVAPDEFTVEERQFDPGAGQFVSARTSAFARMATH
ncbi:MAG: metallophosphoesterase [Bacteroidota bacterium]